LCIFVIGVPIAVKRYGAAAAIEGAGHIEFSDTKLKGLVKEGLLDPELDDIEGFSRGEIAVDTERTADGGVIDASAGPCSFGEQIEFGAFGTEKAFEIGGHFEVIAAAEATLMAAGACSAAGILLIDVCQAEGEFDAGRFQCLI